MTSEKKIKNSEISVCECGSTTFSTTDGDFTCVECAKVNSDPLYNLDTVRNLFVTSTISNVPSTQNLEKQMKESTPPKMNLGTQSDSRANKIQTAKNRLNEATGNMLPINICDLAATSFVELQEKFYEKKEAQLLLRSKKYNSMLLVLVMYHLQAQKIRNAPTRNALQIRLGVSDQNYNEAVKLLGSYSLYGIKMPSQDPNNANFEPVMTAINTYLRLTEKKEQFAEICLEILEKSRNEIESKSKRGFKTDTRCNGVVIHLAKFFSIPLAKDLPKESKPKPTHYAYCEFLCKHDDIISQVIKRSMYYSQFVT